MICYVFNYYIKYIILIIILICIVTYFKKSEKFLDKNIYIGSEGMGKWGERLINYLVKLNYPNKNIIWINDDKANIIVKSNFLSDEPEWNKIKKPYIYWSGETYVPDKSNYESKALNLYTTKTQINNNTFWIPYCSLIFNYKEPQKLFPFNKDRKLCGYCNSNPVQFREDFVDLLANKDTTNGVYALGKCIGTSKKINVKKIDGEHSTQNTYKEFSNYAFIICMENKIDDGYVTEKILNGYKAGAIPIYWGDAKTAKELFNPNSFICINDFESSVQCVDYILNLYNDKQRLIKMASEPMFTNNIIPDILQIDNYNNPPKIYKDIAILTKLLLS
jgi:hypothetical protein